MDHMLSYFIEIMGHVNLGVLDYFYNVNCGGYTCLMLVWSIWNVGLKQEGGELFMKDFRKCWR